MDATKKQQLTALQRAFDDTAQHLSVRALIVAITVILKMTLALGLRLNHRYNLGTVLHQLYMGHHTSANRKLLKDCVYQH